MGRDGPLIWIGSEIVRLLARRPEVETDEGDLRAGAQGVLGEDTAAEELNDVRQDEGVVYAHRGTMPLSARVMPTDVAAGATRVAARICVSSISTRASGAPPMTASGCPVPL